MSLMRRILLVLKAAGGGKLQVFVDAILGGAAQLCRVQNPAPIAVVASSFATLSISEIRIVASPSSTIKTMTQVQNPKVVASPTSTYSLSQAA